ncbi:hypothetical protein JCGZ_02333 [Jatropha curcas]|uniref:Uncharacterized protein n=1 Tax=Jatropha curcas TaxID=180498 RepID=A0A067L756_JATCU|nr:uncharacterized protein LOC105632139 [Jatropha curcas]KDP40335.1 hypothetical protein JCGZ_02333 [Jatropha curcas]
MSHSSLERKLQPAKKVWKRFKKALESKFHSFNSSRSVKIIKTKANSFLSYCSLHFFKLFKKRSITRSPPYRSHLNFYSNKNQLHRNLFSPIYIDQLYSAEATDSAAEQAKNLHSHAETSSSSSSSRGKQVVDDDKVLPRREGKAKEKVLYSIEDAWREVVAKSPQLRPVDERAEEFISKFHQEMKLQKEKSVHEFEEMLARSA